MTYEAAKTEVAKKHKLGTTLVTGHKAVYFEEAAMLYAEQFKVKNGSVNSCAGRRSELIAFLKWFGKEYASSEVGIIGELTLIDEYEKASNC